MGTVMPLLYTNNVSKYYSTNSTSLFSSGIITYYNSLAIHISRLKRYLKYIFEYVHCTCFVLNTNTFFMYSTILLFNK